MNKPSNLLKHIEECLVGRHLIEDLSGPNETDYKKESYEIIFNILDDIDIQSSMYMTDEINFTLRLFYKTVKHIEIFNSLDDAQGIRGKVANHIKAKKHGITTIQVGSITSETEGDSPMQRYFEFNVRARMSFNIT